MCRWVLNHKNSVDVALKARAKLWREDFSSASNFHELFHLEPLLLLFSSFFSSSSSSSSSPSSQLFASLLIVFSVRMEVLYSNKTFLLSLRQEQLLQQIDQLITGPDSKKLKRDSYGQVGIFILSISHFKNPPAPPKERLVDFSSLTYFWSFPDLRFMFIC